MAQINDILLAAADKFRGPGGSIAVVRDGHLLGQHSWGFAHMDDRVPMTPQTLVPICSITKHMLCAVLYMLEHDGPDGASLHAKMQAQLDAWLGPDLRARQADDKTRLTIAHLCDNMSGVRDYWAATVLCGAKPEDKFSMNHTGPRLRELLLKSLHFEPGTEYAYSNLNFYIVARLIESVTGKLFQDLVVGWLFKPAGMNTAVLTPDQQPPPPCLGYEGDEKRGYVPAVNGIEWSGDAGIIASLDDMVAYEKYLHRIWTQDYPTTPSWYRAAAEPHVFADGVTPAKYRMGLGQGLMQGIPVLGHGGALRGFRLNRSHAPTEKLSVVVLFNHEASSKEAADFVIKKILNLPDESDKTGFVDQPPHPGWVGEFLDDDTKLRIGVELGDPGKGKIKITYLSATETIPLTSPTKAESPGMRAEIDGDTLHVRRIQENRTLVGRRIKPADSVEKVQGRYRCEEIESEFICTGQGAILYGVFNGIMGKGPVHLMKQLGKDVWVLACPRGIDSQPPGDWTLVFSRDGKSGEITGVTIGCWLTRKVVYQKVE